MKRLIHSVAPLIHNMHPYPFGLGLVFLYCSIFLFIGCGIFMWCPQVFPSLQARQEVGKYLFDTANGFLCMGGILSPLMDLILKQDFGEKK